MRNGTLGHGFRTALALASLLGMLATPVVAGPLFSCGPFDRDGVGGFTNADLYLMASRWRSSVSVNDQDDLVSDGRLNIKDLVAPTGCVFGLSHGLVASYYGFGDGSEDQDIAFPDFQNLPASTVAAEVRIADQLEWLSGWGDFLDADFATNFGAVFEGYLLVPETADYTLHIFGQDGMRLYLDGDLLLSFDRSPRDDETTVTLEAGMYPLRIEHYQGEGRNGRILFDWASNGSVIGAEPQTVGIDYLFHTHTEVAEYTNKEFDLAFSVAPGSQVKQSALSVDVYAQSPGTNVELLMDGQPVELTDGKATVDFSFAAGYNEYLFTLRDLDTDEEKDFRYTMTLDLPASSLSNGLLANVYPLEWYQGIPQLDDSLLPVGRHVVPGATISDTNGIYNMDGIGYGRGSYVRLEGYLRVTAAGFYEIRMSQGGAVFVNGRQMTGIGFDYNRQWWNRSEIYLDTGFHHFQVETYDAWSFPDFSVDWRPDGGDWSDIPNSAFYYHTSQGDTLPALQSPTGNMHGRNTSGLLGLYRFNPSDPFADESGNSFHLDPDDRAITRSGPGLTCHQGVMLSSELAGSQMLRHVKDTNQFMLEADVIFEEPVDDWDQRHVISLGHVNWSNLARVYIQNDRVRFQVWNDQGDNFTITADDVVVTGQRLHITAGVAGSTMRLIINGSQVVQEAFSGSLKNWPSLGRLNLGQPFNRREGPDTYTNQMTGTFYGAAVYNRLINTTEAAQNRNASLAHAPTLPALPAPDSVTFRAFTAPEADVELAEHVLNRLAFGPSPTSMNRILEVGVNAWIEEQLNPTALDNSHMDPYMQGRYFIPDGNKTDFQAYVLFRQIYSTAQFQEVMTQFWDNHFNTQLDKVDDLYMEWRENETFRKDAFGNFRDLLYDSATGYPMTLYLDNNTNVVGAPNENYAREIFELFTMGVNNGYTHDDIVEAARVFTGWTVRNGQFHFDPGLHDYGEKTVLGVTYPAGRGFIEGIELINDVAQRQETADYITWKMVQLLIDDEPPADVWTAASNTFISSNGDIAEVLRTITNHAAFRTNTSYRGNKTKTPLEFVVSSARAVEAFPMAFALPHYMVDMGMDMFEMADPTGYEEMGVFWIDTNSVLNRWNAVSDLTSNRGNARLFSFDLKRFLERYQIDELDELLDFFALITTGGKESPGARAIAEGWMTNNDPGSFVLDDATIDQRVRQTLALYMRLAEFNKQ